jgi:type II secretory pathway component GspD/PulD (secretin)
VEALRKVYPPPGSPQWPTEDVNETHSRAAQDTNGVTEIINMLPDFLKAAGADLASPKSIFFNERLGLLMVRATRKDLDIIEQVIQVLNSSPPQLMIEVKFCEMTQADKDPAGLSWLPGTILTSNSAASTSSGILTESQFRKVSQMLAEKRGVDLLSTPKVTTLSGRQAQIKVVDVKYIVTDLNVIATNRTQTGTGEISAIVSPITEPMEFGAVLAVVPYISADGYTIQMTVNASIKEFLGYEPALTMPCNPPTTPRPKIRQRLVTTTANVYDGQTLVLQGGSSSEIQKTSEKIPILGDLPLAGRLFRSESSQITKKQLLIFVTPTAIDPAGNRVHSPEKMPPSTKGIPPQPAAPAK